MQTQSVAVTNPHGFHARPASLFVKQAKQYKSKVSFRFKDKDAEYDAKSIITVLKACVVSGSEIELITEGPDETEALIGMVEAVQSGLGE